VSHPTEQDLLLHQYEPEPAIGQHLAACAECRARVDELSRVLSALGSVSVPERGDFYGRQVWHRLEARLDAPRRRFLLWPRLVVGAALAALLVGAFLAGRHFPSGQEGISAAARERLLLDAIGEHLERSQMVLVELDGAGADEVSRARADRLVPSSRLYRTAAQRAGEENLARLLEELERVLLEFARTPADAPEAERAALQKRAEEVLFKVRVLGLEIRERELLRRQNPNRSTSPTPKRGLA